MNLTKGLLEPLQPYKASVGNTAAVATIVQFLTGSLVCLNLVSNECAKNVDCVPLIGGILKYVYAGIFRASIKSQLFSGILALLSLFLNNDSEATVFICSIAALALYTIYTLIYILYTCNWKEELCLALAAGVGIAAVVLGYTHYQDPELVPWIFELIVAAIALTVLGSPLLYTVWFTIFHIWTFPNAFSSERNDGG